MKQTLRFGLFTLLFVTMAVVSSCSKDTTTNNNPEPPSATINEKLNHWMFDYMQAKYLWNDAIKTLKPDFSINYNDFLQNILTAVAEQGDVNHDDGRWADGEREYFYSNIQRFKLTKSRAVTRGTREMQEGLGIALIEVGLVIKDENTPLGYFRILAVSPGSPADKAGLKRGMIISRVNGTAITTENYNELASTLQYDQVGMLTKATLAELNDVQDEIIEKNEITMVSASFVDNPVWLKKIFTADNGDKVGYLCYHSFNSYYDQQMMDAFKEFKTAGVKELILDLRYNFGGHLLSSVVMGTMIAGEAKKDQIFSKVTYNKTRTDLGETDNKYLIGNKVYKNGEYQLIADAVGSDYALGLKRIYVLCTEDTASASELIINGLRGLDIEVHLIGTATNGKNVGMEPVITTQMDDQYEYMFSPITFYTVNAKDFKDYSNGFEPDVVAEERTYVVRAWGAPEDPLLRTAMKWINDGVKPSDVPVILPTARAAKFEKYKMSKIIKCGGGLEGIILPSTADQAQ